MRKTPICECRLHLFNDGKHGTIEILEMMLKKMHKFVFSKASSSVSHSIVSDSVTPWTVAHQAPLSLGFSRHEYQSGLPFPSPVA